MPRTVATALYNAMYSGAFSPYMLANYYVGANKTTAQVLRYRLTGTELDITTDRFASSNYPAYIDLLRGAVIDGSAQSIATSKFYIGERHYEFFNETKTLVRIKATLFPQTRITLAGDDTYANIITAFCSEFSKTAVFLDGTAAFWDYQMLPAGKQIILNNAMQFLNMLRQKYFIFACDNGDEEVLFFAGMQDYSASPDYTIWMDNSIDVQAGDIVTRNVFGISYLPLDSRTYIARDEAESIREGGTAGYPIHNLGYLEAAADFPDLSTQKPVLEAVLPINLKPLDGDIITADPNYFGSIHHPIEVIEEFEPKKKSLNWSTTIRQINILENTAGGALPSTIERVSNYTPLNTGMFDGLLNRNHNNLQAAMDALDNYAAGWIDCLEGWTYVSAYVFTVVDDKTAKFRAGARVRYTQGAAFEYGIVQTATYNAGTNRTTVTLFTNADYAFANGTIYDKSISYLPNPQNFPNWFSWTPSYAGSGTAGDYHTVTTTYAKFQVTARTVFFRISAVGTTANAPTRLDATPPCTIAESNTIAAPASIRDATSGALILGKGGIASSVGIFAQKPDNAAFANGAGRTMVVSGFYDF